MLIDFTRLHAQPNSGPGSHGYNCHNMTTLEADLKKQILGRSKAEKVFRPWWDTLEDYLLNCLVLLGQLKARLHYVTKTCDVGQFDHF